MPKGKGYRGVGRDHPAVASIPKKGHGDSGFTRFGRDVLKQNVPRKGEVPKMGRDNPHNPKMPS